MAAVMKPTARATATSSPSLTTPPPVAEPGVVRQPPQQGDAERQKGQLAPRPHGGARLPHLHGHEQRQAEQQGAAEGAAQIAQPGAFAVQVDQGGAGHGRSTRETGQGFTLEDGAEPLAHCGACLIIQSVIQPCLLLPREGEGDDAVRAEPDQIAALIPPLP